MGQTAYLLVEVEVKFRAFGITFGTVKDKKVVPLPSHVVALVTNMLGPVAVYHLDRNGVKVNISIVDSIVP